MRKGRDGKRPSGGSRPRVGMRVRAAGSHVAHHVQEMQPHTQPPSPFLGVQASDSSSSHIETLYQTMISPNVVSPPTLTLLMSRHPCFRDSEVLSHVAPNICAWAHLRRFHDLVMHAVPVFDAWRCVTRFHPKPSVPANFVDFADYTPVHEYTRFAGRTYYRKRHSLGVTFATFVPLNGRNVGVVWTTARKAHLFQYDGTLGKWICVKTLNRQDVPFLTWMRFLGGEEALRRERERGGDLFDRYANRAPQQLFHDLVVPYYGSVEFVRSRMSMRSIEGAHPVWDIVRMASAMTVSPEDPTRMEWHRLNPA